MTAVETKQPSTVKRRSKRRRWLVAIGIVLALAFAVEYFGYPYGQPVGAPTVNTGENGLWLRYTWYFGQRSDGEIDALADNLRDRQIRYAYFHVREINRDGRLVYRYRDQARRLTGRLHARAPGVKLLAWIYAGNEAGRGKVNLRDPGARRNMVEEARWLVGECGFDGVQWDYEVCEDGDAGFIVLLHETKAALPPGAILGAATPVWMPESLGRWGWSDRYYRQIANECDQIAVMCYDTGFFMPRAYVWLARQQVIHVTGAAASANPRCRVLIGAPTYGAGGRAHFPRAENLALALRGTRQGASDPQTARGSLAGVAVFADYTTGTAEWNDYRRLWLQTNDGR